VLNVSDIIKYNMLPPKTAQVQTSFRCRPFKGMMGFRHAHLAVPHPVEKYRRQRISASFFHPEMLQFVTVRQVFKYIYLTSFMFISFWATEGL
jgi:hypothetical protein